MTFLQLILLTLAVISLEIILWLLKGVTPVLCPSPLLYRLSESSIFVRNELVFL